MDQGVIRQTGTPTQIYEWPNSRFVADFIGSINQFEGEVAAAHGGKATVMTGEGAFTVVHDRDVAGGQKVAVAVRPEKIAISRERPAKAVNAVKGTVVDLGYFGKDSLFRVKLPSGALVRVNHVNDRRLGDGEHIAVWEDEVWLTFDPASAILLTE
jgi:putrescine transport system ATP-binding protein